jgi:hypothetical protein
MQTKPPHKPTKKTREDVAELVSFGNTQEQIAQFLDISVDTLVKYYRRELDTALTSSNKKVGRNLFRKAVEDNDLQAQIFWLKTRARWRTDDAARLEKDNAKLEKELEDLRAKLDAQNEKDY